MDKEFQQRVQRVEELLREIETVADPDTRAKAVELVQSLMDFHGAGLERLMELVAEAGEPGYAIFDDFARDGLVGSLLLLYGLHPLDLETRVVQALGKVRPYLGSHGGDVELLSIEEGGVVRLRMQGSCHGCPSSAMTLKLAIEEAIYEAAPDVTAIEVEGVVQPPAGTSGLVQLGKQKGVEAAQQSANGDGKWEGVSGLESLSQNSLRTMEVSGRSVLFCRLEETLYAYGNLCPGCGRTLQEARLEATTLICPACGRRYDCLRAGRGLDHPELHLEPFPLLMEQGRAKVAVPQPLAG
ncbi:MAG TPA: NifU family protein [Pyrinomonadaceae bacterium]|jgi:Fe-S cluster biogenesis protein NfuA/nitrite reductase/ring-hydroxylating ferredoxin subunit|nr:NifU family protein [Pyrinomonadaceae bacterium]